MGDSEYIFTIPNGLGSLHEGFTVIPEIRAGRATTGGVREFNAAGSRRDGLSKDGNAGLSPSMERRATIRSSFVYR
jgi:hypothetical protein